MACKDTFISNVLCRRCNTTKPSSEFYWKPKSNRRMVSRAKCKECISKYPKGNNPIRYKDISNQVFGKLTVMSLHSFTGSNRRVEWVCSCSCGKQVIVRSSNLSSGHTRSCGCIKKESSPSGSSHFNWKGGRIITGEGYVRILDRNNPMADYHGYVLEHRLVMEKHIGRQLLTNENVHHKNGNKQDNRIENLEIWVKSQPCGQKVSDLISWANHIITQYGNDPTKFETK